MKYFNFDRFHAHEVEGEAIKCSQLRHILIYYRYQHFPPWKKYLFPSGTDREMFGLWWRKKRTQFNIKTCQKCRNNIYQCGFMFSQNFFLLFLPFQTDVLITGTSLISYTFISFHFTINLINNSNKVNENLLAGS